jgi:hypothetical protein
MSELSPVLGRVVERSSGSLGRLTNSAPRFGNTEWSKRRRAEREASFAADLESSKRLTGILAGISEGLKQQELPDLPPLPPYPTTPLQLPQPARLPAPAFSLRRLPVPFSERLPPSAVSDRPRSVRLPPQVVSDRLRSVRYLGLVDPYSDPYTAGGKGSRRRYNNYKKTRKGRVNNRRRKSKRGKTLRRH